MIIRTVLNIIACFAQSTANENSLKNELVGKWEFMMRTDESGAQLDTIWIGEIYQLATGPSLIFKEDGTFYKQFLPDKFDMGTWTYDEKNKVIIYKLIYQKPYSLIIQKLIDIGYPKKDENDNYYEILNDQVEILTNEELIIVTKEFHKLLYKKSAKPK